MDVATLDLVSPKTHRLAMRELFDLDDYVNVRFYNVYRMLDEQWQRDQLIEIHKERNAKALELRNYLAGKLNRSKQRLKN